MTDPVDTAKLRELARWGMDETRYLLPTSQRELLDAAADEIERLRSDNLTMANALAEVTENAANKIDRRDASIAELERANEMLDAHSSEQANENKRLSDRIDELETQIQDIRAYCAGCEGDYYAGPLAAYILDILDTPENPHGQS